VRRLSRTERVAQALARAELTALGRSRFSDRYWQEAFSERERIEYLRRARVVLRAIDEE
jgi:hypothetical protein